MPNIRSLATILIITAAAAGLPAQVLINEVNTGDPDWIEVTNFGGTAVDVSGWTVSASHAYSVYPAFPIPNGTTLESGESLLLVEMLAILAPGSVQPPAGATVLNTYINYSWTGTSTGSVLLRDATGSAVDLVVFGTGITTLPPGAENSPFYAPIDRSSNNAATDDVIYRHTVADTDSGADWTNAPDGAESPAVTNPGQPVSVVSLSELLLVAANSMSFSGNTFTVDAIVDAVRLSNGTIVDDAVVDPIIGGTITFSGTFSGSLGDLDGMVFSPATVTLSSFDGSEVLEVSNVFYTTDHTSWILGGALGATPTPRRQVTSLPNGIVTHTGTGSSTLTQLAADATSDAIVLTFDAPTVGATLVGLAVGAANTPQIPMQAALVTDGAGSLQLGVVGLQGGELYNFFAINSSITAGSGPLFGLELGGLQQAIAASPLGTVPFHVLPSTAGTYAFALPTNAVPAGTVVDHVAIEVAAGNYATSIAVRTTF